MPSHQTALAQELKQKIRDEDLTKNATQCSINQQVFPLIPERFLSELPEPPLREIFGSTEVCKRPAEVLGIGPVIATAVVGTVGDPRSFKNGRQFAAWLGLTPRQRSSGNRTLLLGVTKQGDTYLRTLFVQGARAALQVVGRRDDAQRRWLKQLL
jgi:transposase